MVRGQGRYGADIALDDTAYAVFVRSPHAHARIKAIDRTAAMAERGVLDVLTGADLEAANLGSIQPLIRRDGPDGAPMWLPPRPPLTSDIARYVGDPVALIVASSKTAAMNGAEALATDWEPRGAVTDISRAVEDEAPEIWEAAPGNVAYVWSHGDEAGTAAAMADAAHVTTCHVRVSRTTAAPMEVLAAHAEFEAGRYRLTAGVQAPWQTRSILARQVFGIAPEDIEIVVPDVGGSFGMKGQTFPEYAALLYAARKLGRPVRWVSTRSEAFLADDQGRDVVMEGGLGLDGSGRILALEMRGLTALGAYLSTRGTLTTADNVPGICGPYRVPVAFASMRGVYTNTPSISPYRGAGRPEASLLIERLIDRAATETGRDPIELRQLNMLTPADLPHSTALDFTYDSGDFPAVLERALDLADHARFAARREAGTQRGLLRGFGVASVIARSANGQFEAARIELSPGGRIRLDCGAVSQGQGHATVFSEIAAGVLGVDAERIDYVSGSSQLFEAAVGTFGSRSAGIAGPAVKQAAEALTDALMPEAARQLNAGADALTFSNGHFIGIGKQLSLAGLAEKLDAPIAIEKKFAPDAPTFPNSAHVCEVEIDRETGAVRVLAYIVVEDVGTILNPVIVKGQVHGGIAQGLGQAMNERIAFDPATGQPLTGSFMDFAVPRADDFPNFVVESHPVPTDRNPLGVKGAGEGGTIGALPAFQNALVDALVPFGLRDVPMPATAEAIWRIMQEGETRG